VYGTDWSAAGRVWGRGGKGWDKRRVGRGEGDGMLGGEVEGRGPDDGKLPECPMSPALFPPGEG